MCRSAMCADVDSRGRTRTDEGEEPAPPGAHPEGGFALAVVMVLLFAIGVAAATSYQTVRTEASMSLSAKQGSEALAAARAGLERFLAEQRHALPVERTYTFGDARAVVTPRLIRATPYWKQRYLIKSVGTFVDPRIPGHAAERIVYQMVDHHRSPVSVRGALMSPSTSVDLQGSLVTVSGADGATSSDCSEAPAASIAGVVAGGSVGVLDGANVTGSPATVSYPGSEATLDSLGLDWDVMTDSNFPVEHDGSWPDFGSIPSDSFPAVRYWGDFYGYYYMSGRGVLIVTGDLRFYDGFEWDGIILANDMLNVTDDRNFDVQGLVVPGMDGVGEAFDYRWDGTIRYHSCNVLEAGKFLAHLEPVEGTWWEAF